MKKTLFPLLLLVSSAFLPLACGYNNQPYYPVQSGHYHPSSTPVANPTYAVTPPAYKTSWGTAGGPNALAFGAGSTVVYVVEGDGNVAMVEVFNTANTTAPTAQWTAYGLTRFSWPGGVAVNPYSNNVYVADNVNNAVYEFTSAGATVASWTGYSGAFFNGPEGIAFSSATTTLYVADTNNNEVEEFDASGNPLHEWNGGGGENFSLPSAIAFDAAGNVYVADAGNERVLEFNSGGTSLLNTIPMVNYADIFGIAVDGSGNVYAADYGDGTQYNGNGLMEEYDPAGYPIAVWGSSQGGYAFGPDGVALSGPDIYVADFGNDLIQVFGP